MPECTIKYEEKFVAFIDILGFKAHVQRSILNDDAVTIARMVRRLGSDDDMALYRECGAEICPDSLKHNADLSFRITQVSDCAIVSAEVSPAGAINIVNYCRIVAERLLIREHVLCQGYLTKGQLYHEGTVVFGPGYQEAVEGEKEAAAIEWPDGVLGTPFVEIDSAVSSYISTHGDECILNQFSSMTISDRGFTVISPYGIFDRLSEWALGPGKSTEEMRRDIESARDIVRVIENALAESKPRSKRAREKLRLSFEKLSEARNSLVQADEMITILTSPYPAN